MISVSPEIGEAKETVPLDYSGDPMELGFNARYLMDVLEVIAEERVQIGLIDGVRSLLEELHVLRMPMGVVSNSSFAGLVLERELERQEIRRFFRFVISSADYGLRKPDPLIFEVAVRRLGLEAAQVWFAGDNVGYDIVGAHEAGIFPVAFNPRKEIPEVWRDGRPAFSPSRPPSGSR